MKLSNHNSSAGSDIQSDIISAKSNPFTQSNTTSKLSYNGVIIPNFKTIFEPYLSLLDSISVEVDLPEKYKYTPKAFCLEYYGTPDIHYIIMWLNMIPSARYFDKNRIKVIPESGITVLNEIINKHSDQLVVNKNNPTIINDSTLFQIVL